MFSELNYRRLMLPQCISTQFFRSRLVRITYRKIVIIPLRTMPPNSKDGHGIQRRSLSGFSQKRRNTCNRFHRCKDIYPCPWHPSRPLPSSAPPRDLRRIRKLALRSIAGRHKPCRHRLTQKPHMLWTLFV